MKLLFILLIFINFMNYVDRGLISSLNINIMEDFNITNTQSGVISSSFIAGYLVFSPLFSILVEKYNRIYLMIFGLLIWCMSTFLSGFAKSYIQMLISRLFVGIGEAGYAIISPPIIDSYSPKKTSSRWFAAYFLAIPVGFSLGFLYGGIIESHVNWHYSLILESIVMLLLTLVLFVFRNIDKTKPNTNESYNELNINLSSRQISSLSLYKKIKYILTNKIYIYGLIVYIFYTFVIGSYSFWGPTYLINMYNVTELESDYIFGGITISTGLIGTFLGGLLLDKLKHKGKIITAIKINILSLIISLIFCFCVFFIKNLICFIVLLTLGQLGLFVIIGPINSIFLWSVENNKYTNELNSNIKSLACAICTTAIHLFGDFPSPILVGFVQDNLNNWNITMILLTLFLIPSVVFLYPQYWSAKNMVQF